MGITLEILQKKLDSFLRMRKKFVLVFGYSYSYVYMIGYVFNNVYWNNSSWLMELSGFLPAFSILKNAIHE